MQAVELRTRPQLLADSMPRVAFPMHCRVLLVLVQTVPRVSSGRHDEKDGHRNKPRGPCTAFAEAGPGP
jgi:hypothetical protein